jgi:hypothetical protein
MPSQRRVQLPFTLREQRLDDGLVDITGSQEQTNPWRISKGVSHRERLSEKASATNDLRLASRLRGTADGSGGGIVLSGRNATGDERRVLRCVAFH